MRADAEFVAARGVEPDREIVIARDRIVAEKDHVVGGRVGDHDVDVAVAVGVETGDAAPLAPVIDARLFGALLEADAGLSHIAKQPDLIVAEVLVDIRPPAVDVGQIDAAVVVEISRAGTPSPRPVAGAGAVRHICEYSVPIVAI